MPNMCNNETRVMSLDVNNVLTDPEHEARTNLSIEGKNSRMSREASRRCLRVSCNNNAKCPKLPKKLLSLPHQTSCNAKIKLTKMSPCTAPDATDSNPVYSPAGSNIALISPTAQNPQCPTPQSMSCSYMPSPYVADLAVSSASAKYAKKLPPQRRYNSACAFCRYLKSIFPEESDNDINSNAFSIGVHSPGCTSALSSAAPNILSIVPDSADSESNTVYFNDYMSFMDSEVYVSTKQ